MKRMPGKLAASYAAAMTKNDKIVRLEAMRYVTQLTLSTDEPA